VEDVDLAYEPDDGAKTPRVARRCPERGCEFRELPEDAAPPASHGDAWRVTEEQPVVLCRGPASGRWWWCKVTGRLVMMDPDRRGGIEVGFFRDRRKRSVPVEEERRGR